MEPDLATFRMNEAMRKDTSRMTESPNDELKPEKTPNASIV